ncbi:hypothetical protein GCM10017786_20760 [Amycolatopsis deserti]|uniref:Uncharacterized protein n=1 Tax=Amycolatopsis deserti TaxID=185696 RepID=A0ABQ3IR92_9PSEU|nr:hypothetical protein GCM10017786_20760 [Amycolatopsis deserti]
MSRTATATLPAVPPVREAGLLDKDAKRARDRDKENYRGGFGFVARRSQPARLVAWDRTTNTARSTTQLTPLSNLPPRIIPALQ